MDVEYPPLPARDEARRQDPHIARQRDVIGACIDGGLRHQRVVLLAVHTPMRMRESGDAFAPRQRESLGLRIIARDQHHLVG